MSHLLLLLLPLACPLGMLAMMTTPALARRFTRSTQHTSRSRSHEGAGG
jgi:hypothetical protein